jgi:hypothetical protein
MTKSVKALLAFSTVLTFCVVVLGWRIPGSTLRPGGQQDTVDEEQFPIADEAAPEPPTPAERVKKNNKEKKYGKYKDKIGPGVTVASVRYHWPPGFPALPVSQSDAVIVGEVADARAYVTDDKSAVYSEFSVQVAEVLKNAADSPLEAGRSIVVERVGGRVRYPSGHICRFSIAGWGMPRVSRRYVLFLDTNDQDGGYHLTTGYELRNGLIFPLDRTTSSDTDFDAYVKMDEAEFRMRLNAEIARALSLTPR